MPGLLDSTPISHDPSYATQSCNIDNLLMPAKQYTHSRTSRLVRCARSSAYLTEACRLRCHFGR